MQKIAIVTDSNSGITQAQSKQLGVWVLPMPFYINDELFLEDITLTQEQFYDYLAQGADVKTSQPAPGDVTELWDTLLKDYDAVVHKMCIRDSTNADLGHRDVLGALMGLGITREKLGDILFPEKGRCQVAVLREALPILLSQWEAVSYTHLKYVFEQGLMSGISAQQFGPDSKMCIRDRVTPWRRPGPRGR